MIGDFKKGFRTTEGHSVVPVEDEVEALPEAELGTESVKVRKPAPPKK